MSRSRAWWGELVAPTSPATGDPSPGEAGSEAGIPRTRRDRAVDAMVCLLAAVTGALFLSPELGAANPVLTSSEVLLDVGLGLLACAALWWRRRWPLGVALAGVLLGTFSISAGSAALLALFSVTVHRPVRQALLVAALWIPTLLVFAAYSPTTDPLSVLVMNMPLVLAATAWGMFVRARRLLLASLRERAERAEADQRLRQEQARMAERTRIAREMHDVLAHRISLIALHAGGLEVRPDLPPAEVEAAATLMRSTARQALEELRSVVGVLRETNGVPAPSVPQPTLVDIGRLVEDTRRAGARIDFEMHVADAQTVPASLGRDAYRIVQEALTNIAKHASGTAARVRVTGAAGQGLHVSVRNRNPIRATAPAALPGSGAGLLGLQERVQLSGGTLVHGPDGSGGFVVEADLRW